MFSIEQPEQPEQILFALLQEQQKKNNSLHYETLPHIFDSIRCRYAELKSLKLLPTNL